jgi:hypothetical protein
MERHLSDVCGWAPVSTIHSMPDMAGPPAGASVGACGGHVACSGHDGAGHWPGFFRAHPHAALQLPRKQRAPPSQHPLPLRTPVLPGLQCLAILQPDVSGCLSLIVDHAEGGGHASYMQSCLCWLGREACVSAWKESHDLPCQCCTGKLFTFMQIHAGGSALVSDLQSGARAFLEWMRRNLDGGL